MQPMIYKGVIKTNTERGNNDFYHCSNNFLYITGASAFHYKLRDKHKINKHVKRVYYDNKQKIYRKQSNNQ